MDDVTATDAVADAGVGNDQPAEATGEGAPTEAQVFDWEPYSDHVVAVKVNGEERRVPLKQAVSEYMLQADYTRKTQDLAERAKNYEFYDALEGALQRDAQQALGILAEMYGVPLGAQEPPEELTPEEQRVKALEGRVAEHDRRAQQTAVRDEFAALHSKYDQYEIDDYAVLKYAAETNAPSLEHAFKALAFDGTIKRREAQPDPRVEAKRDAQVVSPGHGTSTGAVEDARPKRLGLRGSYEAAKKQHGFGF